MSALKKLAGETAVYGLGTIVPRLFNFLLLPLHTAVFAPNDYGIITYLYAFVAFISIVYMWGMETAFFRYAARPGYSVDQIFNLTQTVVLLISTILSLSLILFSDNIARLLQLEKGTSFIVWLALIMWTDACVAIPFARLRLEQKALQFTVAKVINVIVLVALNFYFLKVQYNPTIGIGYVFLANLMANTLYIFFFFRWLIKWRPHFDRQITPALFSYATPVMLTGLAGMTNEMFSRLTLSWWLPENFYPGRDAQYALGVFGACYKYAVFMNLAVQAFRYAAEPFFFREGSERHAPELFARVNHYFVVVCSVILLAVGANVDVLRFLLGDARYYEGLVIVPILLLAYLFLGVYYNFSVWFKLTDKTYFGTMFTLGGALITIAGNYVLIPALGYLGSSFAALLCYAGMALACYYFGQRYFPIPYTLLQSTAYVVAAVVLLYALQNLPIENALTGNLVRAAATGAFLVAAWRLERARLQAPRNTP